MTNPVGTGPCVRCQQPCTLYPDRRRRCGTCDAATDALITQWASERNSTP